MRGCVMRIRECECGVCVYLMRELLVYENVLVLFGIFSCSLYVCVRVCMNACENVVRCVWRGRGKRTKDGSGEKEIQKRNRDRKERGRKRGFTFTHEVMSRLWKIDKKSERDM